MKRKIILSVAFIAFVATASVAQFEGSKQVYTSPKLKTEVAKHRTIAILPFNASISYKRKPKDFNEEAHRVNEKNLAVSMQQGMYTYLLRKNENYSVTFQDVERTNALLKSKGLFDKLDEVTQDSICKVLGVDAVIKSSYAYERTSSEGGAIAKTVLFGAGFSSTGNGSLTMQVYNGTDGELLWRFYKEMNEDVFGSANQVMERMMRKVSRNFPYEKS
jgi:TolB-like protein